ncbi:FMN-binding protein [Streptomyces sp. NPDC056549]|uniref:FMN-binding protein n=1 Tax=Streptomyces sp. NPDC056549 TaxID=3345864 RepID=UPI0036A46169
MTAIEVPGPEADWQPATQPPYYTGKNPAYQYSVWEHSAPLFQMIGALTLPVQPVAQRLRLHVERSWDGLDELDVVLFRLDGFSFAISKHDGHPLGVSYVWLTQPHEQADKALNTLLEAVGIGEDAVAFRGDAREDRAERIATSQDAGSPDGVSGATLPTALWARLRRAIGATSATQ